MLRVGMYHFANTPGKGFCFDSGIPTRRVDGKMAFVVLRLCNLNKTDTFYALEEM